MTPGCCIDEQVVKITEPYEMVKDKGWLAEESGGAVGTSKVVTHVNLSNKDLMHVNA